MSVAKRKCKKCKEYVREYIKLPAGVFCNIDHAIEFANDKNIKAKTKAANDASKFERRKNAREKKEHYAKDLPIRKEAAKKACHAYIRFRDRGNPCICCDRPWKSSFQAGHYIESGNNPIIMFNVDNIHSQSIYCNKYKGGDSGEYQNNLVKKIGQDRVDKLKSNKGAMKTKRTAQDYKDIEVYFREKLKNLELVECD